MAMDRRRFGTLAAGTTAALAMPAIARAQTKRTLRLGHHVTTQSEQHAAAEMMGQKLAEYSNGTLELQILPAAQMGGQREIIESVSIGTLDMGYGESGLYANYVPQFGIIALPYLYRDFAHWEKVVDGPIGAELAGALEQAAGMKILNWMTAGYRNTFLRTRPIEQPSDFQGVKIRLPEAPVFVRTFSALGAQPTPIPAPEMYTALQTGVVDAMEGSAEVGYTFKIFEVTKYLSRTRHILLDGSFVISAATLGNLDAAQREALGKAAAEAATWQRQQHFERDRGWMEKLAAAGTLTVNDPALPPFAEALASLQDDFAASAKATELLAEIRAA
ncbi:MAG TPA: TRAP transporter substrate-binding protein [Geminicoccaceae bacterium]|nr:TRAP transporter substrate-binding protein [Geminicoccus sp.]HMU53051.1 TRAP transporter substrate-binding protein [Geminicoccaceae bacterium]